MSFSVSACLFNINYGKLKYTKHKQHNRPALVGLCLLFQTNQQYPLLLKNYKTSKLQPKIYPILSAAHQTLSWYCMYETHTLFNNNLLAFVQFFNSSKHLQNVAWPRILECIICFTCYIVNTIGVYLGLQICEALIAGQLVEQWNTPQETAYAFKGDQWVGYDNIAAVRIKVRLIMCSSYCGNFSTNIFQVPGCNTRQVNFR